MLRTLNLGILAHVDAGKTTLTERLLYAAGVIDEIGSVDDGSTQTDSLALERQRGITIKSAVVSFAIDDLTVNLIDTPGHPDFIAEVERVLNVLDGAILVISAVEGVQPQTRVLMRTLRRLRIPTIIFANKIDRSGAQYERLLESITDKLTPATIPLGSRPCELGTREAASAPVTSAEKDFASRHVDVLADGNDEFLAAFVNDESAVSYTQIRQEAASQTKRALVHPVFFGSAITGAGVDSLMAGIKEFLPATENNADEEVSGTVFKVERGPAGEKIAYVRMFAGTIRTRDRLTIRDLDQKVTAISVFDRGGAVRGDAVTAGQIAKLWGLSDVRIGDVIGASPEHVAEVGQFAPPTLETVVVPSRATDKGSLHVALVQLAEQDPLINLRRDESRKETSVSLYGEVQKEVIQATLANDFGVDVTFRETTTICIERPVGTGEAVEFISKDPNPFLATIGLRVGPAPVGSGVDIQLGVELGSMPFSFFNAIEETVTETLHQGISGWQVTDCIVTITHTYYYPRQSHAHGTFDKSMSSTAGDFRNLTPLVLMDALQAARTKVYEPVHQFQLEIPADAFGPVLAALAQLRAVPQQPAVQGSAYVIEGEIPAARVHELRQVLPTVTSGEGVLESAFDHYQLVAGRSPTRPRTDHNPLNRKEYLLAVNRRVGRGESGV